MDYLSDNDIGILALCESWLSDKNCPTTAKIKAHGFKIEHNFRSDRRGGGTALIFKSCYSLYKVTLKGKFSTFEYTVASLKTGSRHRILFLVLYRTGNLTSEFNKELDDILSQVFSLSDSIILAGDFNIHFNKAPKTALLPKLLTLLIHMLYNGTVPKLRILKAVHLTRYFHSH